MENKTKFPVFLLVVLFVGVMIFILSGGIVELQVLGIVISLFSFLWLINKLELNDLKNNGYERVRKGMINDGYREIPNTVVCAWVGPRKNSKGSVGYFRYVTPGCESVNEFTADECLTVRLNKRFDLHAHLNDCLVYDNFTGEYHLFVK